MLFLSYPISLSIFSVLRSKAWLPKKSVKKRCVPFTAWAWIYTWPCNLPQSCIAVTQAITKITPYTQYRSDLSRMRLHLAFMYLQAAMHVQSLGALAVCVTITPISIFVISRSFWIPLLSTSVISTRLIFPFSLHPIRFFRFLWFPVNEASPT